MLKKSLVIISVLCIVFLISSPVFAANMMEGAGNTLNGIKDGVKNMAGDVGNSMEKATDGMRNVAGDIRDGIMNVGNDIISPVEPDGTAGQADGATDGTGADYTATRAGASITETTNKTTTTVWTVLIIAAIAIIALVWYYAAQTTNNNNRNNY